MAAHCGSPGRGRREQPGAQPLERPIETCLRRRQRHAERRRELGQRELVLEAQRQHLAVERTERAERRVHRAERWRAIACSSGSEALAGRDRLVGVVEARGPPPAQLVERQVARHRDEPGREGPRRVVAADPLRHLQPRLLEHVLGHASVSQEPQQVAEEAVLVSAHQSREAGCVAPAKPCGILAVRVHRPSP